ncbi:hypothetical protein GCM10011509_26590 [Ornithinimicrobium pekingense]|uniref:DUF3263 domain-containing protein n=1 Tax=Ornithinimicrobium pekingense TaxID=384677 RepID=A0ABQ2FAA0_9MICO|nr:hypothetical protein GCM10011509_26590 [Ornithinimicrobium pekingense]
MLILISLSLSPFDSLVTLTARATARPCRGGFPGGLDPVGHRGARDGRVHLGSSAVANRELGVELDPTQAERARAIIAEWPSRTVDHDDLDQLLEDSGSLTRNTLRKREEELTAASGPAPA